MKNSDNLIADMDEKTGDYSRLQMLMEGNEEEHRRYEKTWIIYRIIVCLCIIYAGTKSRTDTDAIKAKAAAEIDRYVQQTYGDEFDKFQVSDTTGTYTYNGELTLLYRYYTDPAWPDSDFSIAVDTQGNIARDGYRTNYLKGSVIYSTYSEQYRTNIWRKKTKFTGLASEKGYITLLDNLYFSADFSRKDDPYSHTSYAFDDNGVYRGPVLDLANPPTLNQLAEEFGCIKLEINLAKGTQKGYSDIIILLKDYLAENDIHFAVVRITINSKSDFGNISRLQFTREEMYGDSFETLLADRLAKVLTE